MSSSSGSKACKPINQKNAEKIFESMRIQAAPALRQIKSTLVRWERSGNHTECFESMQAILNNYPDIAKEMNQYIEEPARFQVQHEAWKKKLEELFAYLKAKDNGSLGLVLETLKNVLQQSKGEVQDKKFEEKVKRRFLDLFKNDEETYTRAKNILDDVDAKQPRQQPPQQPPRKPPVANDDDEQRKQKSRQEKRRVAIVAPQIDTRKGQQNVGVCAEEMACLLRLDRRSATFAKLLHLYELCIVTRTEVMAMVRDAFESDDDFDLFRDIIELRESERRKAINLFKPLNDLDFTHSLRATPSYVEIPWSYPICCAGKAQSPIARAVLNDKWVSVPVGSEHNFSIRVKNTYEDLLLKSEDERYELDLYTVRLRKSAELMKKIATEPMSDEAAHKAVATVVSMGVIQAIYKNGQREQKEQLQANMKANRAETCLVVRQRMVEQLTALRNIREVHGMRLWHDVAEKNFHKSLDRKCFEMKKNERQCVKQTYFEAELDARLKQLRNKDFRAHYFHDDARPFTLLNSFEAISRTERCESHSADAVPNYDADATKNKGLLPAVFLLFDDRSALQAAYSFLHYYVGAMVPGEVQRTRVRKCAAKIFEGVLGCRLRVWAFKEGFSEDVLERELAHVKGWSKTESNGKAESKSQTNPTLIPFGLIETQLDGLWDANAKAVAFDIEIGEDARKGRMRIKPQPNDELGYLPAKGGDDAVVFISMLSYTVVRILYMLFERMLRAREILSDFGRSRSFGAGDGRFALFKLLLMQYVKAKELSRYEQHLEELFGGEQSFLFSTMHKLAESLTKALQSSLGDPFSCKLLQFALLKDFHRFTENEYSYLMLVNKLALSAPVQRLVRLHISAAHLISVNSVVVCCQHHTEQTAVRNANALRVQQLQLAVEHYVVEPTIQTEQLPKRRRQVIQNSGIQLMCIDQTPRLYIRPDHQDFLAALGKRTTVPKALRKQLKRIIKVDEYIASSSTREIKPDPIASKSK